MSHVTERCRRDACCRALKLVVAAVMLGSAIATAPASAAIDLADSPLVSPAAPTVAKVKPNFGRAGGGTPVQITGTNFSGAKEVDFGSASAHFTVHGHGRISAIAPAGTGTVDVTVTTLAGTSPISSSDHFSYLPPGPVVDGLSPSMGRSRGGQKIRIRGTGLAGATAVYFGAVRAPHIQVSHKGGGIIATDPHVANETTVDVTVTTPEGTSPITPADEFTYVVPRPTVDEVTPKEGKAAGGTKVHIGGTSFIEVTAVDFGSVAATEFTVNSAGSITAITPEETVGLVTVTVTNSRGVSPPKECTYYKEGQPELRPCPGHERFKFVEPTITNLTPDTGSTAGGASVTVTGTGFALGNTATRFEFEKTPAISAECSSTTTCTVVTPAHKAGTITVKATVVGAGGVVKSTTPTAAERFTYG